MKKFPKTPRELTRREFLEWISITGAALLVSGCLPDSGPQASLTPEMTNQAAAATASPTPAHTFTSTPVAAASTTVAPPSPTPTATPVYRSLAATAHIPDYEPAALRKALEQMLESSGALEDWQAPGKRVGIKVNLTGGTWWDSPDKPPAPEYFATHPAVVGALAEILRDLGSGRIVVMDGLGDETSFDAWGYRAMAAPLGIELIDLCKPDPYAGYVRFPVGSKAQVYEDFWCNGVLRDLDMLISVAKMKVHTVAGVTLSMKNLFGMVPISEYRRDPAHNNRSWFHESTRYDPRLAKIILDLNHAHPVHLALIDGIMTAEGGAGPWDAAMQQVKPGVLVLSRDPVAADAVAVAVMGFDPAAAYPGMPFLHCDNHLALAALAGMGTNDLGEIGIVGNSISELLHPFKHAG